MIYKKTSLEYILLPKDFMLSKLYIEEYKNSYCINLSVKDRKV